MANAGVHTQRLGEELHIGLCRVPGRWHGTPIRLSTALSGPEQLANLLRNQFSAQLRFMHQFTLSHWAL